jgi:Tfx family DNA-binding protein
MTQRETARELRTSRANVSMIELRARRKIREARETLRAYQSTLTDHSVQIPKGTKTYDVPPVVLKEGDRFGIHMRSNIVEIIRLVKSARPSCVEGGKTKRNITLVFNQNGKLRIE